MPRFPPVVRIQELIHVQCSAQGLACGSIRGHELVTTGSPGLTKAFVSLLGKQAPSWPGSGSLARQAGPPLGYLAGAPRSLWQASLGAGTGAECLGEGVGGFLSPLPGSSCLEGTGARCGCGFSSPAGKPPLPSFNGEAPHAARVPPFSLYPSLSPCGSPAELGSEVSVLSNWRCVYLLGNFL